MLLTTAISEQVTHTTAFGQSVLEAGKPFTFWSRTPTAQVVISGSDVIGDRIEVHFLGKPYTVDVVNHRFTKTFVVPRAHPFIDGQVPGPQGVGTSLTSMSQSAKGTWPRWPGRGGKHQ